MADSLPILRCHELPRVAWLVGGFPCQDLSSAGKREGLHGERSGLHREFLRLIEELRPRGVLIENVHHSWRAWVPELRRALWALGYTSLPLRLRASDFGAWHERSRVFLVAHVDPRVVRRESWRGGWPFWPESPLFADAGKGGQRGSRLERLAEQGQQPALADADALRELQPKRRESDEWRRAVDGGWWAVEPDVDRVVHGISSRLDRRMAARVGALGNAVVPPLVLWIAQQIRRIERRSKNEGV